MGGSKRGSLAVRPAKYTVGCVCAVVLPYERLHVLDGLFEELGEEIGHWWLSRRVDWGAAR